MPGPSPLWFHAAALVELIDEARDIARSDPLRARACVEQALDLIARHPRPTVGGLAAWQSQRVQRRIESDAVLQVSCDDLARLTQLSVRQFSRAFKVSFGATPQAYVAKARIARAQRMMIQGARLGEISRACGFDDQAHFTRAFRRGVGLTPTAWLNGAVAATAAGAPTLGFGVMPAIRSAGGENALRQTDGHRVAGADPGRIGGRRGGAITR
jgi:AraC family transcriptional regulator